jgi:hypothetical protein
MAVFIVSFLCTLVLLFVGAIIAGAINRASQQKKLSDAAEKYLKS